MARKNRASRTWSACAAGVVLFASTATAQQLEVVTVPWLGNPSLQHQVYSGGTLILQGVARTVPGCPIVAATWDPGDGSGAQAINFADPRALELSHVYNGVDGQPFTAVLSVTDSCGDTVTDDFRVVIQSISLDVEVNMAIDHGLWALHKTMVLQDIGGVPGGYWQTQHIPAETATCTQAFEINGHLEFGDDAEDPYADTVRRGLAHTFTELTTISGIANEANAGGNADSNGNGIGLTCVNDTGHQVYIVGQIVDVIVAGGNPYAIAPTGPADVIGREYGAIVQDCMDAYHYGQNNTNTGGRGSFYYTFNAGAGDNSAAQWWAIGGIGADRTFGDTYAGYVKIPQWVKDENLNNWLPTSQQLGGVDDGRFGYQSVFPIDVNGMNTTPSGMIQLIADDVDQDDPRFARAEAFMSMTGNWNQLVLNDRIYGMYATAKAMRLALPAPIELLNGTLDWYGAQITDGDPVDGLARWLVNTQNANDYWDAAAWTFGALSTGQAIIILSPTIVEPAPVAVCEVDPDTTGVNVPIECNGSLSFHLNPDRNIVQYEWDFTDDGIYDAIGKIVFTSYANEGTYQVRLRVTDDSQPPLTDSTTCEVNIIPPPIPPDSNPGGPYAFCEDNGGSYILDGSASFDPDGQIVSWGWELDQPPNGTYDDALGEFVDVTAYFTGLGPGHYDVGLKVEDNNTLTDIDFTTVDVYGSGDCPFTPPFFSNSSPCGETLQVVADVPFSFDVCALDNDPGDIVTLSVRGLPPGASMDPDLPADGNPICSSFEWTPGQNDLGTYDITFTATDTQGFSTSCTVTLEVSECYLAHGGGVGSETFDEGGYEFQSQLRDIRAVLGTTMTDLPVIPLTLPPPPKLGWPNISFGQGKTRVGTFQVFMYNPSVFPNNPQQWSQNIEVWVLHTGELLTRHAGTLNGIHINAESFRTPAGDWYARFPFTIDGM